MIDLSSIDKKLITDCEVFESWAERLIGNGKKPIGFDVETDGLDFPETNLAGFSLYSPDNKSACYIPINHMMIYDNDKNVKLDSIRNTLQKIFTENIMVTHGGAYDFLLMNKYGFKFYEAIDSLLLSLAMQFQNLALKDLVLEFGLVRFNEVITFQKLMEKLELPKGHVDFSVINIFHNDLAFNYAINDPIFAYHLAEVLFNKYLEYIGTNAAGWNHQAQTNTMLFLCESTAKGWYTDQEFLGNFINQYGQELDLLENNLMSQVREVMGWV